MRKGENAVLVVVVVEHLYINIPHSKIKTLADGERKSLKEWRRGDYTYLQVDPGSLNGSFDVVELHQQVAVSLLYSRRNGNSGIPGQLLLLNSPIPQKH